MIGNTIAELNEVTKPIGVTVLRTFYGELSTRVYFIRGKYPDVWKAKPFLTQEQTKAEFLKFLLDVR